MADRELDAFALQPAIGNNLRNIYEIAESVNRVDYDLNSRELITDFRSNMIRQNSVIDPQSAECDLPIDINNNSLQLIARGNVATTARPYSTPTVTIRDLIFLIIPILTHAYDLINDVYLTIEYFGTQETVYGCLTIAFIIIPAIASTWISSRMHAEEALQEVQAQEEDEKENDLERVAKLRPNFAIVILFQLALPLRYCRSLWYAWKVRKCEKEGDKVGLDHYRPKMLKEQEDLALLNVIECFLESAPQLTLQLTILLMEDGEITTTMWFKIGGGCVTLFTLGWSMRKYHCAIRLAQPNPVVVSMCGGAMLFLWHFCTIAARIFLIGIAASNWSWGTLLACTVIWMGWTIRLYVEDGVFKFCQDEFACPLRKTMEIIRTVLFAAVLAVVYMFTFVNLREGPTYLRYSIYHILCGFQNAIVFSLWFIFTNQTMDLIWFPKILVILSVILFIIGIAAMVVYYTCFHPTVQNRTYTSVAADCLSCIIECG